MKRLDRRQGFVHNPCIDPAVCVKHFRAAADVDIRCAYDLVLRPVALAPLEASARARLAEIDAPGGLLADLEQILDHARLWGLSDDECVLLRALKLR